MQTARDQRQQAVQSRNGPITWLFRLIGGLLAAWLLSILIEWGGLAFLWPEEGLRHGQQMYYTEVQYLNNDFRLAINGSRPADMALSAASLGYHYLFVASGFNELRETLGSSRAFELRGMTIMRSAYTHIAEYLQAAVNITQVFIVRLVVIILTLPIFLIVGIAALIDGLVQRELRKYGGGNESSFVYHNIKPWILPSIFWGWIIYLGFPVSVHPNFVFVPSAMTISITAATFKKQL